MDIRLLKCKTFFFSTFRGDFFTMDVYKFISLVTQTFFHLYILIFN